MVFLLHCLINFFFFKKIKKFSYLEYSPQAKGIVMKVRIMTPKKPNSARRPVVKLHLSNLKEAVSYIPGIGHNLRKHSLVLIRNGRTRDLPGLYLKCIRGVLDLIPVQNRVSRKSLYGVKSVLSNLKKLRRKFRKL